MVRRAYRLGLGLTATALVAACGGDDGGTGPAAPERVASVSVEPSSATLGVGQSVQLSATALDAESTTLAGRSFTWTSVNSTIALVSTTGRVTGVREGATTIGAVVDGVSGSALVTVTPVSVASVDVQPATVSISIGETIQLTATPQDASGNVLTGRTVTWSSSSEAVATVDSNGLVSGTGGGDASVSATAEVVFGTSAVTVIDPTAPRINAVTPFPIVEGEDATLSGVNFGATVSDNTVTVDGVTATVTIATPTSLTITVPVADCRPAREVSVSVTVAGKSGSLTHPLDPAAFTIVGVGEQAVVASPSDLCLQFDESAAVETYLIGVQSTSETATDLTVVDMAVENGLSSTALVSAIGARDMSLSRDFFRPQNVWAYLQPTRLEAWLRHRRLHAQARYLERQRLRLARPDFSAAAQGALAGVIPPDVQVGDEIAVRVTGHFPGGCSTFEEITAVVRMITDKGFWLQDGANPSQYSDTELEGIVTEYESVVAPTLEGTFGAIPDTDANGKVAFVITREVNEQGWLSYPNVSDYLPRADCAASNEGDWLYVATPDPLGVAGPDFPASFLTDVMGFSLAHDFTHVIQNRSLIAGGSRPDPWIEEGQATLGSEIYAHESTSRSAGQNYGANVIFASVGTNEIRPYSMVSALVFYFGFQDPTNRIAGAPEQCSWLAPDPGGEVLGPCSAGASFNVAWAFLRWLTDHYAVAVGGDAIFHGTLIDAQTSGFQRVADLTGVDIETLLARFSAMLYVDDRISLVEPTLALPSWDLFDMDENLVQTARLLPRERTFTSFSDRVSVRAGSTAYFLVTGPGRPATTIAARDPSGGSLGPEMQMWVVRIQ